MSKTLFDWYVNSRQNLDRYELEKQAAEPHEIDEEIDEMVKGWRQVINIIEKQHPEIIGRYMRDEEVRKSFTKDQINFICYQIGDWYLMVKELLEGQHNLGYMKERLKIMICGE